MNPLPAGGLGRAELLLRKWWYDTIIPRTIRLGERTEHWQTILEYEPQWLVARKPTCPWPRSSSAGMGMPVDSGKGKW